MTKFVGPKLNNGKLWNLPTWTLECIVLFVLFRFFQYVREILEFTVSLDHPVIRETIRQSVSVGECHSDDAVYRVATTSPWLSKLDEEAFLVRNPRVKDQQG